MGIAKRQEFIKAYEQSNGMLFRYCYFRVHDEERAQEVTQETFIKTWEYLETHDILYLRAFLFKTALHLIIDTDRKHHPEYTYKNLEEIEDMRQTEPDVLAQETEGECVHDLLKRLTEPYRQVLLMRYMEDLKPKEIASLVGQSPDVVSVRLHRGIKYLRKLYEEQENAVHLLPK